MSFFWNTLLRLAYALRLRWPFIWLQRLLKGELSAPREPLPTHLKTPEEIYLYAKQRFKYRKDEARLGKWIVPMDWVTDPEVMQHRLNNPDDRDGDCDDIHFWAARMLQDCPGVSRVYLCSSGFVGGAHTTCVYRYNDAWYHLDYRIYTLANPNSAPMRVASRYTRPPNAVKVTFSVFETIDPPWRAVAIGKDQVPLE